MLGDLIRWEPYRSLAPPPTRWVNNLRTWANVSRPVPDAEEQTAEAKAKAYEWTADVKSANRAVELLERWAPSDKPFFLGVGFYKPHVPLVTPQRFFDLYPPEKMPLPGHRNSFKPRAPVYSFLSPAMATPDSKPANRD